MYILPFKEIVRLFSNVVVPVCILYIFAFVYLYFESYFSLHSMENVTLFILTISFDVEVSGEIPIPVENGDIT